MEAWMERWQRLQQGEGRKRRGVRVSEWTLCGREMTKHCKKRLGWGREKTGTRRRRRWRRAGVGETEGVYQRSECTVL